MDPARRASTFTQRWLALCDLVQNIAKSEIEKVKKDPSKWFSKVLIFNKMIGGTAPHLRQQLSKRLEPLFAKRLEEVLVEKGWTFPKGVP